MHELTIQVNSANFESSETLTTHATQCVQDALKHFADRVTRVEVHLHDDNADKHGPTDKRCTMEGRLAGQQPIVVDASDEDFYKSIKHAADKLGRALSHKLEKMTDH